MNRSGQLRGTWNNAHYSELVAHLRDSHVPELLLLRYVRRVRIGHGTVQGRELALTGHEQDRDRVCATALPDGNGGRQDLPGKEGKSDRARNTDSYRDNPDYSQHISDALLPPLAVSRAQARGDSL